MKVLTFFLSMYSIASFGASYECQLRVDDLKKDTRKVTTLVENGSQYEFSGVAGSFNAVVLDGANTVSNMITLTIEDERKGKLISTSFLREQLSSSDLTLNYEGQKNLVYLTCSKK